MKQEEKSSKDGDGYVMDRHAHAHLSTGGKKAESKRHEDEEKRSYPIAIWIKHGKDSCVQSKVIDDEMKESEKANAM